MTTYGVTDEGFLAKTLAIIQDEIDEALKSTFGAYINTLPQSVFGQLKAIFSERESLLWELAEAVYDSQYPDTAEGTSLDNVAAITALTRLPALASTVEVALFGTLSTVIPAGTIFSVEDNETVKFTTDDEVTLAAGTDEVQTITFSDTPTSGSFTLTYNTETTVAVAYDDVAADLQTALNDLDSLSAVTVSGSFAAGFVVTFAGADGKQPHTLLVEATNTLLKGGNPVTMTITETTPGVYQGTVDCTATETGPLVANAESVTVIDNPISGLDSIFNPEDATVGQDIETDAAFRIRRNNRLQISKAGPIDAIRANILDLNDDEDSVELEAVKVFENYTNTTDSMGLPAKSFAVYVYQAGGVTTRDQEIADAIFEAKPAGIEPYGSVSKTVTDSQGYSHTMKFSRPTEIDIYLILDLTVTSDYPTDGDDVIEAALVAWGNALGVGVDVVVFPSLIAQLASVAGITDVTVKIGTAPAPTLDSNIDIDDGTGGDVELSRWSTSRITINHV